MDLPRRSGVLVNGAGGQSVIECLHRTGKSVARGATILLASTRLPFLSSNRAGRTHDLFFSVETSTRVLRGLLHFVSFRRCDLRCDPAGAIAGEFTGLRKELGRARPIASHSETASADHGGAGWCRARFQPA